MLHSTEETRPGKSFKTIDWLRQQTGYTRMQLNRIAARNEIPGEQRRPTSRSQRRFDDSKALRKFVQELRTRKARFVPKPPRVRSYVPEDVPTPADPPANDLAAQLRDANNAEEKSIRQLANCIAQFEDQIGETAVNDLLEKEGISHQKMIRVRALLALPEAADEMLGHLSTKHAVVVVKAKELTTNAKRIFWLEKARKHSMTPLQLRRSITVGKVVTNEDVRIASGRGSGVLTIQNGLFQLSQWYKHIRKADPIAHWTPAKAKECLELFKTVFTIINDLTAAANIRRPDHS